MPQGVIPYQIAKPQVSDPLHCTWPAMLCFELALNPKNTREICREYAIEHDEWLEISGSDAFRAELKAAVDAVRKEGGSFKVRAMMQSHELLKESWAMIHDKDVPAAVRADLLKHTIRVAGLDASKDQGTFGKGGGGAAFSINLNLGAPVNRTEKIIEGGS